MMYWNTNDLYESTMCCQLNISSIKWINEFKTKETFIKNCDEKVDEVFS